MDSSTLRTRLNDERRHHRSTRAAGDANDDVEARRAEPTEGSARGLRRRRRHYSRRSNFLGTVLPHATSTAALARGVCVIGAAFDGASFAVVRRLLLSSPARRSTTVRAIDVAAVAAVADVEEGAADTASLADDVKNWTIADSRATNTFRLCCVWMTQTTARGPVASRASSFSASVVADRTRDRQIQAWTVKTLRISGATDTG